MNALAGNLRAVWIAWHSIFSVLNIIFDELPEWLRRISDELDKTSVKLASILIGKDVLSGLKETEQDHMLVITWLRDELFWLIASLISLIFDVLTWERRKESYSFIHENLISLHSGKETTLFPSLSSTCIEISSFLFFSSNFQIGQFLLWCTLRLRKSCLSPTSSVLGKISGDKQETPLSLIYEYTSIS